MDNKSPSWCRFCKRYIGEAKLCPFCNSLQTEAKNYPTEVRPIHKNNTPTEDKVAGVLYVFYRIFITLVMIVIGLAIVSAIYYNLDIISNYILIILIVAVPLSVILIKFVYEDIKM